MSARPQGRILVIEDEEDLLRGLAINLSRVGYDVRQARTGEEGLELARRGHPDLIVLDLMLPGVDGIEVCRKLRERRMQVPIIMLTARSAVADRVVGLEAGADDYVTKPFSVHELIARIRARLRSRSEGASDAPSRCRFGGVEVDFEKLVATRDGKPIHLTQKELELLRVLVGHRGRVVSRQRLLEEIWGYDPRAVSRTVDTHVLTLRHKVERDPANPRHILTCYGEGYRFVG